MTTPNTAKPTSHLRQTVHKLLVMRYMFPKCYYCAGSIGALPLRELVKIAGKDRLAHKKCPGDAE